MSELAAALPPSNGTRQPPTDEVGAVGLPQYSGRVYDEPLAELQGLRGVKVYREMGTDPVVGAVLFAVDELVRRVEWSAEPASDDPGDRALGDFVLGGLNDLNRPWSEVVSTIGAKHQYGWAYTEVVYKRREGWRGEHRSRHTDGLTGWRKFAPRLPETLVSWDLDDSGGVAGMVQAPAPDYRQRTIPISRAALFRTTTARDSPEGSSRLRTAYRPWYFKRRFEVTEAIGIDRDLSGLPVARVPADHLAADASPAKVAAANEMLDIASRVRRDEEGAILLASDRDASGNYRFDIELVSAPAARPVDVDKVIVRYDQRIAMTCLADFILLGHSRVGTEALAESKSELFLLALNTSVQQDADVLNSHVVPRLLEANGWDPARSPKLVPGSVERVDLKELGEYITALAGAGAPLFPDAELSDYLLRRAHLPTSGAAMQEA